MEPSWPDQRSRWARFEEWERSSAEASDFGRALAWMADAWEIATRHSEWWSSRESAEEHWAHLAEVRRRLARARISA